MFTQSPHWFCYSLTIVFALVGYALSCIVLFQFYTFTLLIFLALSPCLLVRFAYSVHDCFITIFNYHSILFLRSSISLSISFRPRSVALATTLLSTTFRSIFHHSYTSHCSVFISSPSSFVIKPSVRPSTCEPSFNVIIDLTSYRHRTTLDLDHQLSSWTVGTQSPRHHRITFVVLVPSTPYVLNTIFVSSRPSSFFTSHRAS